ncbi:signal peptidase I [Planctomycetota bacterium]
MYKDKVIKIIKSLWKEWCLIIFLVIFVVIPVKSSLADWNWVPSGSMNPTILEGDLIYINKLAYDLRLPLTLHRLAKWSDPDKGDIVICFSPEDGTRLVKRVIACPGDTVEMRNNVLFLNDEPMLYTQIDSKYTNYMHGPILARGRFAMENLDGYNHPVMSIPSVQARRDFGPEKVPQGSYFVLGDNRDSSRDSRYFGFVERKFIIGKAKGVIGSFDITDKYQPRFKRFFSALK